MTKKVLVAYVTKCGSTETVANRIGQTLRATGAAVDVLPAKQVRDVSQYDAAIFGSAIRMGRTLGPVNRLVRRSRAELANMPTACFAVCMAMYQDTEENRQKTRDALKKLCDYCTPASLGLFAGVMDVSKLSPWFRKMFEGSEELPEGDYRDWEAIDTWTKEFATHLA